MKFLLPLSFVLLSLTGYAQTNCDKKNIAEVSQQQGVYIFVLAKPTHEYDYLGTMKVKVCLECRADEMVSICLKKLKKDFPEADGMIFTTSGMGTADAIKFKSSNSN